ncbi:MAG: putative outer membrane protein, putative porin precursor, partial [Pseudolabrys sp.]|nr:putative outer membrane protein, putative porin precursor [Pseudolabrys sp.]
MKMVKSLILGSAAGLVAMAGAQAADLPVKAKPVQYVKICSLYGAGFYYIPGTDTCIKIGGYVRAELNYQAGGSFNPVRVYNFDDPGRDRTTNRVRGGITVDVRSQTEYGTLRSYATILPTSTNDGGTGGSPYASPGDFIPAIFIQFAGFTAGKTASFFDYDLNPYSNQTNIWGSNQAGNGISIFGYTAQFGNGFSASLSLEDQTSRRSAIGGVVAGTTWGYEGRRWPDLVANLRIDQAWGGAQVMAALHDTAAAGIAAGPVSVTDTTMGWAIGAGLKFNLPMIGHGDYVIA